MPSSSPIEIYPCDDRYILQVTELYAQHVINGLATWEYDPPSVNEMLQRREKSAALSLPWLVALDTHSQKLAGFAYASAYHTRVGWRYTVEDSIYLDPDYYRQGIGRRLLQQLIQASQQAGMQQMIAVIGDSNNQASQALHSSLGFEPVGVMKSVGFKHDQWIDAVYMQRSL